jgi:rhodanese-related sulfurtransferase
MSQPGTIPTVNVTEASSRLQAGTGDASAALLVDVREVPELVEARVAGAAQIPMSAFADRFNELPKDRPLLVMCAAGNRSAAATSFLLRNGWTDVTNVDGGITAWQRAGLPVIRGPLQPGEGAA